jgi:hypothetical protein
MSAEFVYLTPNAIACALPQGAPVSDYSMTYEGETTVMMFKRALAANGPVPGRRQTGQYIVNLAEVRQCCLPGPGRLPAILVSLYCYFLGLFFFIVHATSLLGGPDSLLVFGACFSP